MIPAATELPHPRFVEEPSSVDPAGADSSVIEGTKGACSIEAINGV